MFQLFILICILGLSIQKHVPDDEALDFPLQSPREEVDPNDDGLNRPSVTNISQSCQREKGDTVACFFVDSVKRISETLDFYYKKLRDIFGWAKTEEPSANNSTVAPIRRDIVELDQGLLEIGPGHQELRLETETMHRRRKMHGNGVIEPAESYDSKKFMENIESLKQKLANRHDDDIVLD
ncbi:unnamed protein product [Cylicostephanus goldi]|uniref:Uncharacterized protein n=1 Tax=Cylicostephanus goldi TaxID=71465 RepID=A0A3P6RR29_CYLGO|nr:unnamed protein product [Cylicostephanus goldi]